MRYIFMIIFVLQCLSSVSVSAYCLYYNRKKLFSSLIFDLLIAAFFLLVIFDTGPAEGIIVFLIYAALIIYGLCYPVSRIHNCLMCIICRRRVKFYSEINSLNEDYVHFLLCISPKIFLYDNHDVILFRDSVLNEFQNAVDDVRLYERELNLVQRLKNCF